MGYIPGEPALPDDMRGGEFIRFLAAYRGMRGTAAPESFASALSWTPRAGYGACPRE